MTRPCLLLIDLLNDFLASWPAEDVSRLISANNSLAAVARQQGHPVIWVRQEFLPDLSDAFLEMRDRNVRSCIAGTHGAQLHPDLAVCTQDHIIVKKRYSAFFRTGLDDLLARLAVDQLIIGGINTHACIRMAAIDAYQRDLRVVIAAECTASYDSDHAKISLAYMDGKIASVQPIALIMDQLRANPSP